MSTIEELKEKYKEVLDQAETFSKSLASRGLDGTKVELTVKNRRVKSCLGTEESKGCSHVTIEDSGKYCGLCGCPHTALSRLDGEPYSKLDFPYLECPLHKDGFSNEGFVFNADTGGIGDLIIHFWIAEGYKRLNKYCGFFATKPERIELCKLFGQKLNQFPQAAITIGGNSDHYKREFAEAKGCKSRVEIYKDYLPFNPEAVRPRTVIDPKVIQDFKKVRRDHLNGRKKLVVIFPFTDWAERQWPLNYWCDLAWQLEKKGIATITAVPQKKEEATGGFPYRVWGYSWTQLAALILVSDLTIGCDSGPAHLAGTLGSETIALMGPTKKIFNHCENVEQISSSLDCVGCCFDNARGFRASCNIACRALSMILPEPLVDHIMNRLEVP